MDSKKYYIVAEDMYMATANGGIIVAGNLHGTITVGDEVNIMHPKNEMITTQITKIETDENGKLNEVHSATDCCVEVWIESIKEKSAIKRYSVLSSEKERESNVQDDTMENPYLKGLLFEFKRFLQDHEFTKCIMPAILRAQYVTPIRLDKEPVADANGKMQLAEDTKISFMSLTSSQMDGSHVLPIFTDIEEMNRKSLGDSMMKPAFLHLTDCIRHVEDYHENGIIINPFSDNSFFINEALMENIKNTFRDMKQQSDQN